jgi:predicted ATPase
MSTRAFTDRHGTTWHIQEAYAIGVGARGEGDALPRPTQAGVRFWTNDGREVWGHGSVGEVQEASEDRLRKWLEESTQLASRAAVLSQLRFQNFKALRDCALPLGRLTLLVGPNGSGKSTALEAIRVIAQARSLPLERYQTAGVTVRSGEPAITLRVKWQPPYDHITGTWLQTAGVGIGSKIPMRLDSSGRGRGDLTDEQAGLLRAHTGSFRVYAFNPAAIAQPMQLNPEATLQPEGSGLVNVLDRLRDTSPEQFAALNEELHAWLPEYDRVLFDTPSGGVRSLLLRTTLGQHRIPASEVSHGTLLALALMSLRYAPDTPPLFAIEEPERGIHPRLLRDVRDALYRLAYPEAYGDKRPPRQIIVTTHSPYMLDLFREHLEDIVIASKLPEGVRFDRLADRTDLEEFLRDAHLGEVWYSGILGGVPLGE